MEELEMPYIVFPEQETIANFKVQLTEGEQDLLNHLTALFNHPDYQNRNFEIHVQSNLFFGKPDFIIIEPGYSMWIIEVKDYNKGVYQVRVQNNQDKWQLVNQQITIPSPIKQVQDYKNKFIEYAGPSVSTGISQNKNKFALTIRTAVFFYHLRPEDFQITFPYTTLLYPESFAEDHTGDTIRKFFEQIGNVNIRLSEGEYQEIRAIIDPGENGQNIPLAEFTGKYGKLCQSEDGRKKIKGIAGTGKTSILAKRAVSASRRFPDDEILVSCFNITMCNYLQDKIVAEGGKSLNELGIRIQHFHSLYEWKQIDGNDYVINGKKSDDRYTALFIDEGQDFERNWFDRLISDYLINKNGEFVIFADENQNIYNRLTIRDEDEFAKPKELPNTPVPGRWTVLNEVHRTSSNDILFLLNRFAKDIFRDDNTPLDLQLSLLGEVDEQTVFFNDLTFLADATLRNQQVINEIDIHIRNFILMGAAVNDIVILSTEKNFLREIEFQLRTRDQSHNFFAETITTFKPKENASDTYVKDSKEDTSREDRPYKHRFYRNNGPIKFSTIHSFKGWETPYVILTIPHTDRRDLAYDYLVYTGISRAKRQLAILNMNSRYADFFNRINQDVMKLGE